jgi:hypothetical protein
MSSMEVVGQQVKQVAAKMEKVTQKIVSLT